MNLKSKLVTLLFFFLTGFVASNANEGLEMNATGFPDAIDLGSGKFDFGGVTIDRLTNTLSLNALCNQRSGLIEYALVHEGGKIHESLFRTKIPPRWIHACLLLVRVKPFRGLFEDSFVEGDRKTGSFPEHEILVSVTWENNGTEISRPLSSLIYNQISDRTLDSQPFVFTGSRTIEGVYLAERDGSILAVYHDPVAIINSLDRDSHSDDSWVARPSMMPPIESKVRLSMQILPKSE